MLSALIAAGCDVDAQDLAGHTPCHAAASVSRHLPMLETLIAAGADLNAVDFRSRATPAHLAALRGNVAAFELLQHAGADMTIRNVHGVTPLRQRSKF